MKKCYDVNENGNVWTYTISTDSTSSVEQKPINFIPTHIIYSNKTTICFFDDGTKVMVTCAKNEEYSEENGVAMCIAKKIFGSRSKFLKYVEAGYHQPPKELK